MANLTAASSYHVTFPCGLAQGRGWNWASQPPRVGQRKTKGASGQPYRPSETRTEDAAAGLKQDVHGGWELVGGR